MDCFLAIDLGADSGRVIRGELGADARLRVAEVHRFANRPVSVLGRWYWDLLGLYRHVLDGLAIAAAGRDGRPQSLGIDTWGVDFCLLDGRRQPLAAPRCYRDPRHREAMAECLRHMPAERIYELTGVQLMPINSLFQLYGLVIDRSPILDVARFLVFMPDVFNLLLTGKLGTETTIASTSQLYDPRGGRWAAELLAELQLPGSLLPPIGQPGTVIGRLRGEVAKETGLGKLPVVAVASHDTASAVAAVPATDHQFAYISSGTWSLVGIETTAPIINEQSRAANFTNEVGFANTFRVLRNVNGLWLLQACRRRWQRRRNYSYPELVELAVEAPSLRSLIDPDHPSFLSPSDMPRAIAQYCRASGQPVPSTVGAYVRCVLESLALAYRRVLGQLKALSPHPVQRVHIVGGGSQNALLCQLTADATGLPVCAGPVEATAIGNLLVQAIALGRLRSLAEMREVVRRSFPLTVYEPQAGREWEEAEERLASIRKRMAGES